MLQLATSLLHCSAHHLPLCPTPTPPPPPLIEMGITTPPDSLFLLAWTGGAERKQSSRIASVWLTSKGKDRAVRMLISLHLNLQPAGKHLSKTPAIHHIQTAASSISCTPKAQRNQQIGASWQTLTAAAVWTYINMSAKYECKQVLPLVKKCCQLGHSGGCRADSSTCVEY